MRWEPLKRVAFDAGALPFRDELLGWLPEERAAGRRLVLVADGDPKLDQQIADHLGLFDEVARADGADRPPIASVARWSSASASTGLTTPAATRPTCRMGGRARRDRRRRFQLADRVGHTTQLLRSFPAPQADLRTWIKAIRLHQWVKNALVFLPALLAHHVADATVLLPAVLAFLAFGCLRLERLCHQ